MDPFTLDNSDGYFSVKIIGPDGKSIIEKTYDLWQLHCRLLMIAAVREGEESPIEDQTPADEAKVGRYVDRINRETQEFLQELGLPKVSYKQAHALRNEIFRRMAPIEKKAKAEAPPTEKTD